MGKLAKISNKHFRKDFSKIPGTGAAGGLGYSLISFAGAQPQSGFEIFSRAANLEKHLPKSDLVLTGEGAIDHQTLMGKGVGQIALLCKKFKIPCIGIAGIVTEPEEAKKLFTQTHGLTEITSFENAKARPSEFLEKLVAQITHKACGTNRTR
jgi:glycerate kinase